MNRIPTEGLKHSSLHKQSHLQIGLNEQNPDRGIETTPTMSMLAENRGLNEQNPDRGIETHKGTSNASP